MIGICTVSVTTGALSTVMPSADVADEASGMAAATVLATELAVVMSTSMDTADVAAVAVLGSVGAIAGGSVGAVTGGDEGGEVGNARMRRLNWITSLPEPHAASNTRPKSSSSADGWTQRLCCTFCRVKVPSPLSTSVKRMAGLDVEQSVPSTS